MQWVNKSDQNKVGEERRQLMWELFPICRSITVEGDRETLNILQTHIALNSYEVPSGTQSFDWIVPSDG